MKTHKVFFLTLMLAVKLSAQEKVDSLQLLDDYISKKENMIANVIPECKSKIVWANGFKEKKSPLSFVYLHGFGASHREGEPIISLLSKEFNANVYMARLAGQGISDASGYQNLTPKKYLTSAKEALKIGKKIGNSVILISTSTGGTLSLKLASEEKTIKAIVLYSPFIDVIDQKSLYLLTPKGKAFAIKQKGGEIFNEERPPKQIPYWSTKYHINGYVALLKLLKSTMKEDTFKKVTCPVFLGYYYKDEQNQDKVVSVKAMKKMYQLLGTNKNSKEEFAFPNAKNHVIGCDLRSEDWKSVYEKTREFIKKTVLK